MLGDFGSTRKKTKCCRIVCVCFCTVCRGVRQYHWMTTKLSWVCLAASSIEGRGAAAQTAWDDVSVLGWRVGALDAAVTAGSEVEDRTGQEEQVLRTSGRVMVAVARHRWWWVRKSTLLLALRKTDVTLTGKVRGKQLAYESVSQSWCGSECPVRTRRLLSKAG